jgi:hypothetical protein
VEPCTHGITTLIIFPIRYRKIAKDRAKKKKETIPKLDTYGRPLQVIEKKMKKREEQEQEMKEKTMQIVAE